MLAASGAWYNFAVSDRKYRQRGYQDAGPDPDGRPRRRPAPGERGSQGPRGRGLGKPSATVFRCSACGGRQPAGGIDAEAVCSLCGADLHTCTHCRAFDPSAPNECREPIGERVRAKAKRNRCQRFAPRMTQEFAREAKSPEGAKAAFEALFKT